VCVCVCVCVALVIQHARHNRGIILSPGIHQIKSFVSKGVTCKLCLQEWDTRQMIQFYVSHSCKHNLPLETNDLI